MGNSDMSNYGFLYGVLAFCVVMVGLSRCSEETTIVKPSYCVGNCVPCKPLVKCKILVDSLKLELEDCSK